MFGDIRAEGAREKRVYSTPSNDGQVCLLLCRQRRWGKQI